MKTKTPMPWTRARGPLAVIAVAAIFGVAVVAPIAMPSAPADAEALAFQARIHQEFIPNDTAEADLVYVDLPVVQLPDPEEERKKQEAEAAQKKAEAEKAAAESGAKSSSGEAAAVATLKYTGGGSPAEWMSAAGIAEADWGFVDYIASKESGWNPNATNASSGACGLIQAYPCSKVPGSGYDPIDNLRWASGYAVDRYGSWSQAYAFWTANHWW